MNQRMKMRDGCESCIDIFTSMNCNALEMMHTQANQKAYVNVNTLQKLLGHLSEATMRKTSKEMIVMLVGIFEPC